MKPTEATAADAEARDQDRGARGAHRDTVNFLNIVAPDGQWTFQTFDDSKQNRDGLACIIHDLKVPELERLQSRGAGVFLMINRGDGNGRATENVVEIRAVFLDLDGTPLPDSLPLQPHTVIESSPGRFHVYWLVVGLPLAEFPAIQQAIAEMFGGDPSVSDLPRVMRVPGFLHLKGEPFRARIVEAHPKLPDYSADDIREAFPAIDVSTTLRWETSDAGKVVEGREKYLTRLTLDAVLEAGENPDPEAVAEVVWAKFQADADLTRGKGGGAARYSLRDTRAKARAAIRKLERGELERFRQRGEGDAQRLKLDDFYAYMVQHNYIYIPARTFWPAASVNARVPRPGDTTPAAWLDRNRPVEQVTWSPGEPELIEGRLIHDGGWAPHEGARVFNLYRPPAAIRMLDHETAAVEAKPWLDHFARVYPDEAERRHAIHWMAHRVQRPDIKINHGLILAGMPGGGKDTILVPVRRAVGEWNFRHVTPGDFVGKWNDFARSVVLCVSEARDEGENADRFALYEHAKIYAAAPPETMRIDEKHLRHCVIPNVTGLIITTNHQNGVYLPANDRRFFVMWSDAKGGDFAEDYFIDLYDWYDAGGCEVVASYLATLDLTGFDPKAPPPKTAAFWTMVDLGRSPEAGSLSDLIEELGRPDALVISDLNEKMKTWTVNDQGSSAVWEILNGARNARRVPHLLQEAGYLLVANPAAPSDGRWKVDGKRQKVYAKKDLTERERLAAATALENRVKPPV